MFLRQLRTLHIPHNYGPALTGAVDSRLCLFCHNRHIANRSKSKHISKHGRQVKGQKSAPAIVTPPTVMELFKPAVVEPNIDTKENDLGEELAGKLSKDDVAVIDEIQLIGDQQRGSSWSRALLGIAAREIHVCGEETAIDLVEKLTYMTGRDSFEVRRYERLTKLEYLDEALVSLDNLRDGDCIVCFRTLDIFNLLNKLRERKIKAAVIYGNLPPGTKIKQAALFNDQENDCNILLATDAIGMGLNLVLKKIVGQERPNVTDIFVYVAKMNESYFMCNLEDMKALAQVLQDIPMNMRSKFTFCVAPLKIKDGFPRIMFKKMAKLLSEGHSLNFPWLSKNLGIPFKPPRTIAELQHLQAVFNVIDIYLWLSYRFTMFDDIELVQDLRVEVDTMIQSYLRFLNSNKETDESRLDSIVSDNSLTDNPLRQYQAVPKKQPTNEIMDILFGEKLQTDVRSRQQVDRKTVSEAAEQPVLNKSETNAKSTPHMPSDFTDFTWKPPSTEDEDIIFISSTSKTPAVSHLKNTWRSSSTEDEDIFISSTSKTPAVSHSKNLEAVQTCSNSEILNSSVEQMESDTEPIDDLEDFTQQIAKSNTSSSTPKVINFWSDSEIKPDANVSDNTVFKNTADVISRDSVTRDAIADEYGSIEDEIDNHLKNKLIRDTEFPIQLEPSELNEVSIDENDTDFVKAFTRAKLEQMNAMNNTSKQTSSVMEKHGKIAQQLLMKKVLSPRILEALLKEWDQEKQK
ncbi:SUV3-like protein [Mya arenaria]|uniref:SUV3-like protein n=1 Tax=Mya arenaria TaxID=6604 RepID=A0ABY7FMC6_MYAAR|nr:SUV3-like protein [Mya arenaria]